MGNISIKLANIYIYIPWVNHNLTTIHGIVVMEQAHGISAILALITSIIRPAIIYNHVSCAVYPLYRIDICAMVNVGLLHNP